MRLVMEHRPILALSNCYLSISADDECDVELDQQHTTLIITDNEGKRYKVDLAPSFPLSSAIHMTNKRQLGTSEYVFRLQHAGNSDLVYAAAISGPESTPTSEERARLKSLATDIISAGNVLINCSKCGTVLSSEKIQFDRVLPTPSVHWNELSSEWFCGCSNFSSCCDGNYQHQNNHSHDNQGINNHNHTLSENTARIKNKQLSAFDLRPREKDLLYAPGFFLMRENNSLCSTAVKIEKGTSGPPEVRCKNCESSLGTHHSSQGFFHLWQHSVVLQTESGRSLWPKSSAEDTFRSLLMAMVEDQPQRMVEVAFEYRNGNETTILTVKMMEQKLQLLCLDFNDESNLHCLKSEVGCKLLFKFDNTSVKDWQIQVMDVNHEVMEAGLQLLKQGQKSIPSCFREDRGWSIAILRDTKCREAHESDEHREN